MNTNQSSLRQRAADRAQNGGEVATRSEQGGEMTVFQAIERQKAEIARALPKHMDADRIARIATTVIRQTPALGRCDVASLLGALMTASQLGLEPGPLGEAYLVPYGRKVTFIPGYRGLIKLAWQSGRLQSIQAHTVCERDEFDYEYGLEPKLRHKPALNGRGKVIAVYAAAVFKDGGSAFVVMSTEDVEAIRKRSASGKNGPWVTDWDAMARKTAVRQLARWLPMSTELQSFQQAVAMDDTVRSTYTSPVEDAGQVWVGEVIGPDNDGDDQTAGDVDGDSDQADADGVLIEPDGWAEQ
jgi:recombination protein RecT